MKNVLSFQIAALALLTISCEQKETPPPATDTTQKVVAAAQPPTVPNCDEKYTTLVVDIDELKKDGKYTGWIADQENIDLFCNLMTHDRKTHTHEMTFISLESFKDIDEQMNWLQTNSKYICYEESYPYIEKLHMVRPSSIALLGRLSVAPEHKVKFSDIVAESKLQLSDRYKNFLTVTMTPTTAPKFGLDSTFTTDPVCLSMPFLSSIFENNKQDIIDPLQCDFFFKCVMVTKYSKTKKVVAFRIEYNGKKINTYYDYSTQPGTASFL